MTSRGELLRDLFNSGSWTSTYKPDCIWILNESMRQATFDSNNTKLYILPASDPNPYSYENGIRSGKWKYKFYLERNDGDADKIVTQIADMHSILATAISGYDENYVSEESELYYREQDKKHVEIMGFITVEDWVV